MKLDPDIYRNAARHIAWGWNAYCCTALAEVAPANSEYEYIEAFKALFDPSEDGGTEFFWAEYPDPQDDNERIFALLLMAEIVERENKPRKKNRP